ncbi:hypothetical protein DFH07DRAFT_732164 [Mycena maculata]|uniref:Prolyl 4-hydroxylase alpha subunit Fe(2+) 2OG dioxygenase domain-containing protein n=1 Tax=Mycena maculata TaxID=230809 RepID=A0AAD7K2S8_9AGAR|nr:hypothetical protein DFH07DRAFT_732164 [Mycena maculata]
MSEIDVKITAVKNAIRKSRPMCSGTCEIPPDQNVLVYGFQEDGTAKWVDLLKATPEQLDVVSAACQRATFGRNKEDVFDETYRKAGQMSTNDFRIGFNLEKSGIIDAVYSQLLDGFSDPDKGINAELYKLNIYDKGSFFKAHKDTPRGQNMFGSLVIVFPTVHAGGALLVRHDNKEEAFDSSKMLAPFDTSNVAYIAFYGDVEHEVAVVESGHRVTLTYNLYFAGGPSASLPKMTSAGTANDLQSALVALLDEPNFLADGGILGFGMRYKYPVDSNTNLRGMKSLLKGADALLVRVCEEIGLQTSLKAVYSPNDEGMVMMDKILDPDGDMGEFEESATDVLSRDYGGEMIQAPEWDEEEERNITAVKWITPMSARTPLRATYIAYGNEHSIEYVYGDLALMVHVPDADSRGAQ